MITALELTPQDRKLVPTVGAEMLAQTACQLRLLDRSKLKRDPQELVQRAPELAGRERTGLLCRHAASVLRFLRNTDLVVASFVIGAVISTLVVFAGIRFVGTPPHRQEAAKRVGSDGFLGFVTPTQS